MKRNKISEFIRKKKLAAGSAVVALALVIGGLSMAGQFRSAPEFPSYTDPVMEVSIQDEETPLAAAPKVTKKTTKKTTKKKVTLKSAASKTYTKKLPTVRKTSTKTLNKTDETVRTDTTVLTAVTEKYTKKSKTKVVNTTVTTTITTTTTAKGEFSDGDSNKSSGQTGKYETDIEKAAPLMDSRVLSAYNKLGFKTAVDSSVSYAGHFDARTRTITLQRQDDTVYHELGHFLAFITGNTDKSSSFVSVYSQEKAKFTGVNKAYATQNSSEYFAESLKDYIENPSALKSSRPKTYAAMTEALDKVTAAQVTKVQTVYGPFWK